MSDAPTPSAESVEAAVPAPRLLLVDDEPGLRTAVQAYLEDEGFEVTTAVDGEEGFAKAQQMLPDVVISDVMMPRLDGYGLLQKLRADERLGGTPVIFLPAQGMTADRTQGYLAGVDDYIPKPFDPDELVARVRNVAQRQQRLLPREKEKVQQEQQPHPLLNDYVIPVDTSSWELHQSSLLVQSPIQFKLSRHDCNNDHS